MLRAPEMPRPGFRRWLRDRAIRDWAAGGARSASSGLAPFQHGAGRGIFKWPLSVLFVIPLSKDGGPLSRQVYVWLRRAILVGSLRPGESLPSTRDLAEQLGVSRTVILLAYDQLLAEGFVEGRAGSGTYVAQGPGR